MAKCGFASLGQVYRLSGANPPPSKHRLECDASRGGVTADNYLFKAAPCCTRTENARAAVLADKGVVDGLF